MIILNTFLLVYLVIYFFFCIVSLSPPIIMGFEFQLTLWI